MVVGVLIDTLLVRSLLIPGLVSIFGEWSWWPGRRDRAAAPPRAARRRRARTAAGDEAAADRAHAGDARHAGRADHAARGQGALHAAPGRVSAGAAPRARPRRAFGLEEFVARVARARGRRAGRGARRRPRGARDARRARRRDDDGVRSAVSSARTHAPLIGRRAGGRALRARRRPVPDDFLDAHAASALTSRSTPAGPRSCARTWPRVAPQRARRDEHLAGREPRGDRAAVLLASEAIQANGDGGRGGARTASRAARRRAARAAWPRRRAGAGRPPSRGSETAQATAAAAGAESPPLGASRPRAPARRARHRRAARPCAWPLEKERTTTRLASSPTRPAALSAGLGELAQRLVDDHRRVLRPAARTRRSGARARGRRRLVSAGEVSTTVAASPAGASGGTGTARGRRPRRRGPAAAASPASRASTSPRAGRSARSSSPAPWPSATCSGASPKRAATASRAGRDVRVGVERAAQREGRGVDGLGVRRLEPARRR